MSNMWYLLFVVIVVVVILFIRYGIPSPKDTIYYSSDGNEYAQKMQDLEDEIFIQKAKRDGENRFLDFLEYNNRKEIKSICKRMNVEYINNIYIYDCMGSSIIEFSPAKVKYNMDDYIEVANKTFTELKDDWYESSRIKS